MSIHMNFGRVRQTQPHASEKYEYDQDVHTFVYFLASWFLVFLSFFMATYT